MVYRGGPKRAALFVRAVAVVAPSLQGGIFDSRGGGLQTAAFDSLNAFRPCITLSSRIPLARYWRTQVRDLLFAFPPFPTAFPPRHTNV